MALEPRIEAVRAKYDLAHSDFWQIKQNGQWVCKHAALEIVAVKAGIQWLPPQIIEADAPNLVTSMVVTGQMGDRVEWATGETNATNYQIKGKQPAYPWAMSEKRAKDFKAPAETALRQEQKVANDAPKPISAAEQKRQLVEIDNDLSQCNSVVAVKACADGWQHIAARDGWSRDYKLAAAEKFKARREAIINAINEEEAA